MNKTSLCLISLIIGIGIGYGLFFLKYNSLLQEGRERLAGQEIDQVLYADVTSQVQIVCNSGNNKILLAQNTSIKFTSNDFDNEKNFIGHDKNAQIQKICEVSSMEKKSRLERIMNGIDTPELFKVVRLDK